MLSQGLGCGFQNEAAITASIQMPFDLTFHARRELPFQVPANQMDGIPTVHSCPTSSGPAWVGPFSWPHCAICPGEKLFKMEHPGLAPVLPCLRCPTARHSERSRPTFFLPGSFLRTGRPAQRGISLLFVSVAATSSRHLSPLVGARYIVPSVRLGGTAIPACPEPVEWGCVLGAP